jgi:hypothetical protein
MRAAGAILGFLCCAAFAAQSSSAFAQELQVREEFMERAPRLRRFRGEMIQSRPSEGAESQAELPFTRQPVRFYVGFEGPPGWKVESLRLRLEGRSWRVASFGEGVGTGGSQLFWASLNMGKLPIGVKSVFAEARVSSDAANWPFSPRPTSTVQAAFVPIRLEHETSEAALLLQAFESKSWRLHDIGVPR